MKNILITIGYFLLEIGANFLIRSVFGSKEKKNIEDLIAVLEESNMSPKEKYEAAKEYIDGIRGDAPETLKNVAIETIVMRVGKGLDKAKDYVKERF